MENQAPGASWYYAADGKPVGPFTLEALREKLPSLQGDATLVYGPATDKWIAAGSVAALQQASAGVESPVRAPMDADPQPRAHAALWLVYLFVRPRLFFQSFVIDSTPLLTALCVWTFGMMGVIDRLDTQELRGRPLLFAESWGAYWAMICLGGVFAGLIYFGIGGWWYRVRLQWSGAVDPDAALARRVYVFATQVVALPTLAVTVVETSSFPTPGASAGSDGSLWYLAFLVFPFWSVWNSYVGVRTAFAVRRGAAMLWFLILPSIVYALVFGAVMVAMVAMLFSGPDLKRTSAHDSATMTFDYPGNWWIDTEDEEYDPNAYVSVEPVHEAFTRIMLYESEAGPEAEVEVTLESYRESATRWRNEQPFATWGSFRGTGISVDGVIEGQQFRLRVFVAPVLDGMLLEIQTMWAVSDESSVMPGFDLIEASFRLK